MQGKAIDEKNAANENLANIFYGQLFCLSKQYFWNRKGKEDDVRLTQ